MTLQGLEQTLSHLHPMELARFREWFREFDAACWDEQIDADATA